MLRDAPALLLTAPLWIWWALVEGGYPPAVWLLSVPYLTAAAAMLTLLVPRPPLRGARRVAVVALGILVAWTWLSVLWAADRGSALLGAERTLAYALAFALPVLWPPGVRGIRVALLTVVAASAAAVAVSLAATADATESFAESGRLVAPTGYVNATAALWATGAVTALVVAADALRSVPVRAAALGVAAALAGATLLTQSRGAVAGAVVALAVAFALMPHRIRLAVGTLLLAGGVLLALDPLLDVRRTATAGDPTAALASASRVLAILGAGTAVAAAALVLAERALPASETAARRAAHASRIVAAVLAVGAAVAFVAAVGNPVSWAGDRYRDFKVADYSQLEQADTRFTGELGSNRYDYWRAAADAFAERPLLGQGAANFAAPYLERRRVDKAPLYAHSVWFQTLSDLGAVGLAALLAFCGALAVALAAAWRRSRRPERAAVAAATVPLVYLVVHASADWVSFFPALAVPALALAGAASGVGIVHGDGRRPRRSGRAAVMVGLALLGLSAVAPLAAARLTDHADSIWRAEPDQAFRALRDAEVINPLSARAPLLRGVLALELGARGEALEGFRVAARRDRSAWYPRFALGLLAAASGERAGARRWLSEAAERNPREPRIREAIRRSRGGRALEPLATQREIFAQGG